MAQGQKNFKSSQDNDNKAQQLRQQKAELRNVN